MIHAMWGAAWRGENCVPYFASCISCPGPVVAGAEDRITRAAMVRKVARKYARVATLNEFAGHAHGVTGEPGWEQIGAHIADWLAASMAQAQSQA